MRDDTAVRVTRSQAYLVRYLHDRRGFADRALLQKEYESDFLARHPNATPFAQLIASLRGMVDASGRIVYFTKEFYRLCRMKNDPKSYTEVSVVTVSRRTAARVSMLGIPKNRKEES